jgi:hypothetical protein
MTSTESDSNHCAMSMRCVFAALKPALLGCLRLCGLFACCTLLPTQANADGWTLPEARPGWERFALGFVSGVAGHELGHYLVATAKGYEVHFDGPTLVYSGANLSGADQLQVASAGFQAQWLLAELALRDRDGKESKSPPGDFGAGVVCAHLGITFAYLTFLKNNKQGDVAGMADATGYSHNQIAAALAIPAVLDAWRLFGNQVPGWVSNVSVLTKGAGIVWVWTF